jgi:hypothetical protein
MSDRSALVGWARKIGESNIPTRWASGTGARTPWRGFLRFIYAAVGGNADT